MIIEYKGKHIQIDREDLELLNSRSWHWINSNKKGLVDKWYLKRNQKRNNKKNTIYFHREIIKAAKGEICDHIDGNTLNNSRQNLRIVNASENRISAKKKTNKELPKGVYQKKGTPYYYVTISRIGFISLYIGSFYDVIEAENAYIEKSLAVDNGEIKLKPASLRKRRQKQKTTIEIVNSLQNIDKSKWCEDRVLIYNYLETKESKNIDRVISKYYQQLVRICVSELRKRKNTQEEDAYDIVQDTLLIFIDKINNGKFELIEWPRIDYLTYFLKGILKYEILNHCQKTENTSFVSMSVMKHI